MPDGHCAGFQHLEPRSTSISRRSRRGQGPRRTFSRICRSGIPHLHLSSSRRTLCGSQLFLLSISVGVQNSQMHSQPVEAGVAFCAIGEFDAGIVKVVPNAAIVADGVHGYTSRISAIEGGFDYARGHYKAVQSLALDGYVTFSGIYALKWAMQVRFPPIIVRMAYVLVFWQRSIRNNLPKSSKTRIPARK